MGFSIDKAEEKMLPWYKKLLKGMGLSNLNEKDSMVFGISLTATMFFMMGLFRMLLVVLIATLITLLVTGKLNPLFSYFFIKKDPGDGSSSEDDHDQKSAKTD